MHKILLWPQVLSRNNGPMDAFEMLQSNFTSVFIACRTGLGCSKPVTLTEVFFSCIKMSFTNHVLCSLSLVELKTENLTEKLQN